MLSNAGQLMGQVTLIPAATGTLLLSLVVSCVQGPYWSLMFEVSESYLKPVNQQPITLAGTAGQAVGL